MNLRNMSVEEIEKHRLNLDDTFDFMCRECGDCCHEREDIPLTPYDLFRVSRHLRTEPPEVVEKNCEVYTGEDSKLPIVRLRPKPHGNVCPFLKKGRCSIHTAKPVVCAIFPLARVYTAEGEVFYVDQQVPCGERGRVNTVRDWLKSFDILEADKIGRVWGGMAVYLAKFMRRKSKLPEKDKMLIWEAILVLIYFNYDIDGDFTVQLEQNFAKIKEILALV